MLVEHIQKIKNERLGLEYLLQKIKNRVMLGVLSNKLTRLSLDYSSYANKRKKNKDETFYWKIEDLTKKTDDSRRRKFSKHKYEVIFMLSDLKNSIDSVVGIKDRGYADRFKKQLMSAEKLAKKIEPKYL